tara:strand:+ start:1300 stop:1482 length:183 start_codon:yes stop_codon:yes gene_type:complete
VKVGDLVKHFLTEQIGIIVFISPHAGLPIRVLWTTQGDSLFGPGNKEWCGENQLDLLTTA